MNRRTRIKICGLTREEDVEAAVLAGVDAIGFVFYAKSSRCVSLARAVELMHCVPPFVTPVGLFVNAGKHEIEAASRAIPQLLLQFHGDETPRDCADAGRPFLRAARMVPGLDLLNYATQYAGAQALLVDADVEGYGGGGKVFDWSLVPSSMPLPIVLSGGLHAGNVIRGIHALQPWAVDVSTGVEVTKGVKDADAVRRFCEAVREADARAVFGSAVLADTSVA